MNNLEDIISAGIAPAMLERVVADQDVIGTAQRNSLFMQADYPKIVAAVVEAYGTQKPRLAYGLYHQISTTDWKTAQRLMRETPYSLRAIAIDSGFGTLQRFCTAFREATGETPATWRANHLHPHPEVLLTTALAGTDTTLAQRNTT